MGSWEEKKPTISMLMLQFTYAAATLSTKAALSQGMSPNVFVVYRQAIATLVMAPIAYIAHRKKAAMVPLRMNSLGMMFLASLVGITINQNCYLKGLYYTSSSIATAMSNLLPAITFMMAVTLGLEKVNIRSLRSMAKVIGTIVCIIGAASMALLKGQKLLNMESVFNSGGENWVLGCLYLFGSCCCWSFWLIIQVPMSESYPDHLSLSAWMCFFGTLQSGIFTYFLEPDPRAWKFNSSIKILCCFYSGIIGSGVSFGVQSWCISKRGPLFSAMFSPLCTVIATISACLFLHEELYIGSLAGAVAVVAGLYVVLWSKGKDLETREDKSPRDDSIKIKVSTDETLLSCKIDLKKPLLAEKLHDVDESETNQ